MNRVRQLRLERLLPQLMRETGFDMWIMVSNEDHNDPVFTTMVPYDAWLPITQMLVLYDRGPERGVERLSVARPGRRGGTDLSWFHENAWDWRAWDSERKESQWDCLARIVRERDPKRIGINESSVQWAADALTATLRGQLVEALGAKYSARMRSAEPLATRWLETVVEEEVGLYEDAVGVARGLLAEAFSTKAIAPGVTTLTDLSYHIWQRGVDLGIEVPVPPHFCLRRSPEAWAKHGRQDELIRQGDLIHSDFVIRYLGYYTDHQEWGYVPREGEQDAPESFRKILTAGNRLQDIFAREFKAGLTGNRLLANIHRQASEAGIVKPKIYSHSIGQFLHEPGPLIGLPWEQQDTGARGEGVLANDSAFAVELSVSYPVPEWGGVECNMGLEQLALFTRDGLRFLGGRQERFHIVR